MYDCSCLQRQEPSLNDCLDTGPCLMNDLVEILIRFRLHPKALVSDIEKAFLNAQLEESDRDYTKFLWFTDPEDPDSEFKTYCFKAVLFGSVSSPFILNAVMKAHFEKNPDTITEDLKKNIYIDNLVSGVTKESQVDDYYEKSVHLMNQGGFNLRSWAPNSQSLNKRICKDKLQETDKTVKVLGLKWDTQDDKLSYPTSHASASNVWTKREVVRATSAQRKIFIQNLWRSNLGWDHSLPDDLVQEWFMLKRYL